MIHVQLLANCPVGKLLPLAGLLIVAVSFAGSDTDSDNVAKPFTIVGRWEARKMILHIVNYRQMLEPISEDAPTRDEFNTWIEFDKSGRGRMTLSPPAFQYRIDDSKKPKRLLLSFELPSGEIQSLPCIFEIRGETMLLAFSLIEGKIPRSFDYWKEEDCAFSFLKRSK